MLPTAIGTDLASARGAEWFGHEGERGLKEVETAEGREFVEHGVRRWRPTICRL
jgi:hypothetical protein